MFSRDTAIQAYPNAASVIRWEGDENLRCRLGGIDVVLNVLHSPHYRCQVSPGRTELRRKRVKLKSGRSDSMQLVFIIRT